MIITVGYRVKSHVATRFRIWATQRLKEDIIKGFELNDWISKLDAFLNINDREILIHAGRISHQMAQQRAEGEYERFHQRRIAEQDRAGNDFDKPVAHLPAGKPTRSSGEALMTLADTLVT